MLDRIPYELFSKIIKLLYQHSSFTLFEVDDNETSMPPISASHVCRSWRVALLSDPTMWTCIRPKLHGRDEAELREMLSRSGSAPLDVRIEQFGYPLDSDQPLPISLLTTQSTLPLVSQEMHRIRKLHMLIPTSFAHTTFCLLEQPAPMLQSFYLHLFRSEELSGTLQKAYRNLFLGNAPSLKHVHLQISAGLRELNSALSFKNLSRLYLLFSSHADIDGDILLDMFRSSPCLRDLRLWFQHQTSTIVCSTPLNHHAFLPELHELRLEGACVSSNIDFILGRLKFPADKVRFAISCDDFPDSAFLSYFLSQRCLPLLSISLDDMTINLYENIDLSSPTYFHSPESSVLSITYDVDTPLEVLPSLRILKLSDITHMFLEMIPSGSTFVFKIILSLLVNLLHLRVIQEYWDEDDAFDNSSIPGSSFLKALAPRLQRSNPQSLQTHPTLEASSESDTNPDSDVDSTGIGLSNEASTGQRSVYPCPSLHTLEIVFAGEPHLEQFVERYFKKLAQCCKIRGQTGHPIGCVSILCEPRILAEDMKAWLQANEFDWSRVELQIITSKARKLLDIMGM